MRLRPDIIEIMIDEELDKALLTSQGMFNISDDTNWDAVSEHVASSVVSSIASLGFIDSVFQLFLKKAVCSGVGGGLLKAFKHTDNPDIYHIADTVHIYVHNSISDYFVFETSEE